MSAPPPGETDLRVRPFTGAGGAWDEFVTGSPGWSPCHLWGWKELLEDLYGHQCLYLAAEDAAGDLRGVLPLVRLKSRLFGHYLVSMPFVNYGGPLGDRDASRLLARRAEEIAAGDGVDLLELRCREDRGLPLEVSHRKITVTLALPTDPRELWEDFRSKRRTKIRKPRREGVEVRFGHDQLGPFHRVFSEHMRTLGTPTHSREFFRAVAGRFGERVWFGCAYHGGRPVACGAGFRWGEEYEMTWASQLEEVRSLRPNMLLYWRFMERAIDDGASVFNFGRCTPGTGVHRFKVQWRTKSRDAEEEDLWWYQRSEGRELTPGPDDDRYDLGAKLWKRMPLPLTRWLGPKLIRSVP